MPRRTLSALALIALACAPPADSRPTAPQQVVFTAEDHAFTGPDSIAPGVTSIQMVNRGEQTHHLILARLDEGKTLDSVIAVLSSEPIVIPEWIHLVGAASEVTPGDSTGAVMDLKPGNYLAFCVIPDQTTGAPHMVLGMSRTMVVQGARHDAPLPTNAVDLRLSEFTYQIPKLAAGTHTFRVINDGVQPHEVILVRLAEGATMEQFVAAFAPGAAAPPPGRQMGGSGALSADEENWWTVTLTSGNYAMICLVPDPVSGVPHLAMGMATAFTIE